MAFKVKATDGLQELITNITFSNKKIFLRDLIDIAIDKNIYSDLWLNINILLPLIKEKNEELEKNSNTNIFNQ